MLVDPDELDAVEEKQNVAILNPDQLDQNDGDPEPEPEPEPVLLADDCSSIQTYPSEPSLPISPQMMP